MRAKNMVTGNEANPLEVKCRALDDFLDRVFTFQDPEITRERVNQRMRRANQIGHRILRIQLGVPVREPSESRIVSTTHLPEEIQPPSQYESKAARRRTPRFQKACSADS